MEGENKLNILNTKGTHFQNSTKDMNNENGGEHPNDVSSSSHMSARSQYRFELPKPRSIGPLDDMVVANPEWRAYYEYACSVVSSYAAQKPSSTSSFFPISSASSSSVGTSSTASAITHKCDLRANCQKWQSKWYLKFRPLPPTPNVQECSYGGYTLLNIWKKPNTSTEKPVAKQDKAFLKQLAKNIFQGEAPKHVQEHSLSKLKHNKAAAKKPKNVAAAPEGTGVTTIRGGGIGGIPRSHIGGPAVDRLPARFGIGNKGIGRGSMTTIGASVGGMRTTGSVLGGGSAVGGRVTGSGGSVVAGKSGSVVGTRSVVGGGSVVGGAGSVVGTSSAVGGRSMCGGGRGGAARSVVSGVSTAEGRNVIGAGGRNLGGTAVRGGGGLTGSGNLPMAGGIFGGNKEFLGRGDDIKGGRGEIGIGLGGGGGPPGPVRMAGMNAVENPAVVPPPIASCTQSFASATGQTGNPPVIEKPPKDKDKKKDKKKHKTHKNKKHKHDK